MNKIWVDSHCHLHYDYSPRTLKELIDTALEKNVRRMITIGVDVASTQAIQKIAEENEHVYFTAGIHPHDTEKANPQDLLEIERISHHPKCKAIGELGLDYYYEHSDRNIQQNLFKDQIEIALRRQLPVVIHCREAEADTLAILQNFYSPIEPWTRPFGVIHCFTGTLEFAQKCVALGFLVSFSGILTFKNAQNLRDTAKILGLDPLMVETDAPYLAPVPHRGKKAEPAMVIETAKILAETLELPLEKIQERTTQNAFRLFDLN